LFYEFLKDEGVAMVGVEAGGLGIDTGSHAARFASGKLGVLQGCMSFVLQTNDGQIDLTHSVSAGLDYASVGPEHSYLRDAGRVEYTHANDDEALDAFQLLGSVEGIIPALESAHAVAHAVKVVPEMDPSDIVIVNLSGRGDKDVQVVSEILSKKE
jgi:tryptophan synthase beta chain